MDFSSSESVIIGADIGGSHAAAALVDLNEKRIIPDTCLRSEVNCHLPADAILESWAGVISAVRKLYNGEIRRISIAMPGPFDYEKGICLIKGLDKYESLYGLNIKDLLAARLGIESSDILLRNDAESFLHGETFCGASKEYKKAIGVTLGTGLGSAVSSDGITADVNRAVMPFREGIAEDYISTRWFQKRYLQLTGKTIKDVRSLLFLAGSEDLVNQIFNEFGHHLGLFLKDFISDYDPDVVVIGGNIAKALDRFIVQVQAEIKGIKNVTLKQTELWEDAAIIGAAASEIKNDHLPDSVSV